MLSVGLRCSLAVFHLRAARAHDRRPYVIVVLVDITERKKAHEQLEQAVAERTADLRATIAELEGVSYSLSHDMRAPLRTIQSFSEIVLKDASEKLGETERQLLQKSITAAGRLDRLIQDVLTYSRVARESISFHDLNVAGLWRGINRRRRHLARV